MSTTIYLRCTSHTPPIDSDEIAQRTSALPEIFDAIKKRDELTALVKSFVKLFHERPYIEGDYTMRCALFFYEHPECNIEVFDEYGKTHTDMRGTDQ